MLGAILALCLILSETLDTSMVAVAGSGSGNIQVPGMLNREQTIAYIGQHAPLAGVDPAAMLAIANSEGLNQAPGNFWTVPGEGNISFGPPSWFGGTPGNPAAGTSILAQHGGNAPGWAWTPAGLDYWIGQIAGVASGLSGTAAISAIVTKFERPSTNYQGRNLAQEEINSASQLYRQFQQMITGGSGVSIPVSGGGVTDVGVQPPTGVQPVAPIDTTTGVDTTVGAQPTVGAVPPPTGFDLSFPGSIQHIVFQFLLVLIGIALLLGGIYLLGSHK